jgi:hypothetical protein
MQKELIVKLVRASSGHKKVNGDAKGPLDKEDRGREFQEPKR